MTEDRQPQDPEARDDGPPDLEPVGDERRDPPLVAFGIVAGTAVGGIVGLVVGAMLLGAGIGCAAGVIVGAVAQSLRGRR